MIVGLEAPLKAILKLRKRPFERPALCLSSKKEHNKARGVGLTTIQYVLYHTYEITTGRCSAFPGVDAAGRSMPAVTPRTEQAIMSSDRRGHDGVSPKHRKIIDLFSSEDVTFRQASERLGISVKSISYVCRKYGPKFVREPGRTRFPKLRNRDWLYQKVVTEGLTYQEIADLLGCSRQYVHQTVKEYGIPSPEQTGPIDPTKLAGRPKL